MCDSSSWNFSSSSRNRVELGLASASITSFFWSGSSPWLGGAATPASEISHGRAPLNMQRHLPRLEGRGRLVRKRTQALKGKSTNVRCSDIQRVRVTPWVQVTVCEQTLAQMRPDKTRRPCDQHA